ncbi:MAG: UDP-glucose dehydrogenase family protein [Candidatus Hodarchaeales archaeon]|jgi:UDPglucose 6-dehydrogenase
MRICVVGVGYVGLVTAAVFADIGNTVTCVDIDEQKIERLQKADLPIYEPQLKELVERNTEEKRLIFTTQLQIGMEESEIIFIAVGTPPKESGETDLSAVEAVAANIGQFLNSHNTIIVNKSTSPVGTADRIEKIIRENLTNPEEDYNFRILSNPEFLREGSAVQDCLEPDRIVIGASDNKAAMKLLELYAPLEVPMLITDRASAELIKYAANSFLAAKISFINAIADICERVGADIRLVAKGIGTDQRIGSSFLNAGLGFGGSCFPKDTRSLIYSAEELEYDFLLLRAAHEINQSRVQVLIQRIENRIGSLNGKTIGILGLSFKPNTDDVRDAKSIELIQNLLERGASVKAYDPVAMPNASKFYSDLQVTYCHDVYSVAVNSHALILATEWREFRHLNFQRVQASMVQPALLADGRNFYDPERMRKYGFDYLCLGLP